MKTKAAILWERNTPWSVEEIELDPPKAGEVLVKMAASGMCHSDEHVVTGDLATNVSSVAEGIQQIWPLVEHAYARIWNSDRAPAADDLRFHA